MKESRKLAWIVCAAAAVFMLSGCVSLKLLPTPPDSAGKENSHAPESAAPSEETIPAESASEPEASASPAPDESTKAEMLLQQMTLREKVGQLFIIRPDALDFSLTQDTVDDPNAKGVTALSDSMKAALRQYPAGGIAIFGKNLLSPGQITEFNETLQQSSAVPLFLSIDEEGGLVARLANHPAFDLPQYKSAADVGKSGDPKEAEKMGAVIGGYLHGYGFNMDFAPDADVNTNPDNPIIGTRAFSTDAETAGRLARGMADGLRQAGILPVFKHFPGHGDTKEDSHAGIAITGKSREEMEGCEWLPFLQAQENEGVMVGHIAAPRLTGDLIPATMSETMVTDVLKTQLGFQGLILTDSLSMKAITDTYTPAEAAVTALQAGCDILLMPNDYRQSFDGVLAAVESGRITEAELDQKVLHILECKEAYGIL